MTTKTKPKNRLHEAVYEIAADLYRLFFVDKRKMKITTSCILSAQIWPWAVVSRCSGWPWLHNATSDSR